MATFTAYSIQLPVTSGSLSVTIPTSLKIIGYVLFLIFMYFQ